MQFNAYFEMAAALFLLVVSVHFFTRRRFQTRLNTFFGVILIIALVDLAADIAGAFFIADPTLVPLWLNIATSELYYLCQVALSPLLYLYVLCMTGLIDDTRNRRAIVLSLIPTAACVVLVFLNPVTEMFFYFDENLVYCYGPGFFGLHVTSFAYLIACAVIILKNRQSLRKIEHDTILAFIAIVISAMAVQALVRSYLLSGVALALSCVMMYLTLQNPDDMLDSLTGAFNRNSFFAYIDSKLRRRAKFQFMHIDINDMTAVNELFGIAVGDHLLSEVGAYLCEIGGSNKLFRTVGDSFVLVCESEAQCLAAVAAARERFTRRWDIGEISLDVSAGICYSLSAGECAELSELKVLIDLGIAAVQADKGAAVEITRSMHDKVKRMGAVEALLRQAIDNSAIELFLQPVYNYKTGRFAAAEALSRLRDEDGNLVMPGEFIPIAERTGLVTAIGAQIMNLGCRWLRESGLADDERFEELCVNLSVIDCLDDSLVDMVCSAVGRYNIPPGKVCFEITETTATLSDRLPDKMKQLRELGFKFALDDFGTGYANYDSIIRLPFSVAKFDKTLLDMSDDNGKGELLFFSTLSMVRSFGFEVIVEGVERKEQADMLAWHGVKYAQGFYFSRPVPASDFLAVFDSEPITE